MFAGLEPFGDEWRQTGMIASWIYNMGRSGGRAANIEEFMPLATEVADDKPQSVQEVAAIFAGAGARVKYADH